MPKFCFFPEFPDFALRADFSAFCRFSDFGLKSDFTRICRFFAFMPIFPDFRLRADFARFSGFCRILGSEAIFPEYCRSKMFFARGLATHPPLSIVTLYTRGGSILAKFFWGTPAGFKVALPRSTKRLGFSRARFLFFLLYQAFFFCLKRVGAVSSFFLLREDLKQRGGGRFRLISFGVPPSYIIPAWGGRVLETTFSSREIQKQFSYELVEKPRCFFISSYEKKASYEIRYGLGLTNLRDAWKIFLP